MLKLRSTFEQVEREARTHRLKILPERQKRTQQSILLDDVNFDDFDLSRYDRKEILMNNPDKGTQTDLFETKTTSEKSESIKSLGDETFKSEETENEPMQEQERQREQPVDAKASSARDVKTSLPERERGKSIMRRMYDAIFADDEYREEREELLRNRRAQTEEPEIEQAREQEEEDDDDLPMNVKKSYEPSSSSSGSRRSSTNRSALLPIDEGSSIASGNTLPIEEEALSEHIQSSPPVSVQSSIPSNRTIEYVESQTPAQSVISSRRSQETIEYIRSRSSRGS